MGKNLENIHHNEAMDDLQKDMLKKKANIRKIIFISGFVLLVGAGVVWKCWGNQKNDIRNLSNDELKDLRNTVQDVLLSPDSDQEAKMESIKWINVIDNMIRARDPIDMDGYVFPKGGEHGTNLWKPD